MRADQARKLDVGPGHLDWLGVMGFYAAADPRGGLPAGIEALELWAYPPGADIIREGEPGDSVYVVFQGTAEVVSKGRRVAALSQGDLFGELGFLVNMPRTATVRAGPGCEVFRLAARLLEDMAKRRPELMANLRSWAKDRMGRAGGGARGGKAGA